MKKEIIVFVSYVVISFGCRKEHQTQTCGCEGATTEFVKSLGMAIQTDDGFEILTDEKGLLIPCAKVYGHLINESQSVTVSGTLRIPCKTIPYDFSVTPIEVSEIKLRDSSYDKTDITLTIIKSEDYGYPVGFGYFIEDHRSGGIRILQPIMPAVSGLHPFSSPDQARKAALLVIHLLRKHPGALPSLSMEILQYVHLLN